MRTPAEAPKGDPNHRLPSPGGDDTVINGMSQTTVPNSLSGSGAPSGTVLGEKYRISRLLGEGGMGAVYEGENTWTRRRVAIKVMHPEFARDPESVQRFMREAQSAAQVDHPNVVSVLDLGRDEASGSLFIVQEFLVGSELRALLDKRGMLPPDEALELILPVLDGLVAAHSLGVVHRDLKPENIFLVSSRSGRLVPKLIDFGIAKALRPRENEFRTMVGQTMGTPGYMSPEQARGELDIDARADIWAIGVVLYELLSGRIPYENEPNPQVMLAHVLMEEPLPLEVAAPSVPAELRAVVARALQRDRAKRFPDMLSFYNALAGTALGKRVRDTLSRRPPADPTTAASDAQPDPAPIAAAPEASPAPARAVKLAVAVVVAMLLVGLAAGLELGRQPQSPLAPTLPETTHEPAPSHPVAPPTPIASPPVAQPLAAQPLAAQPPAAQPPAAQPPAVQPPAAQPPPGVDPADHLPGHRPHRTTPAQRGANGAAIIE